MGEGNDGADAGNDGADGFGGGFGGFGSPGGDPGNAGGLAGFGFGPEAGGPPGGFGGGPEDNTLAGLFGPVAFSDLSDAQALAGFSGFNVPSAAYGNHSISSEDTQSTAFQQMLKHPVVQFLAQLHPVTRTMNLVSNIATAQNPAAKAAQTAASMMGGKLGSAVAGPLGGIAGSMAMGGLAGRGNNGDSSTGANSPGGFGGQSGSGFGDVAAGLGGLYAGYRGMRETNNMLGGLQSLYSQNSPYSQALRQQLERRDAASGRRSQYGPREVELQAKLAQLASGQIPAMAQLNQQQQMIRAAMLKSGIGFANKMGLFNRVGNGLSDMFNGTLGGVQPSIGVFSPSQVYDAADLSNTDPGLDLSGLFGG